MPSSISRRRLLSAGSAVALAGTSGCLDAIRDATGSDGATANESSERRLRLSLSRQSGTLTDRYVTDFEGRPDWDEEAFAAAVSGETYTTQYKQPFFAREDPKYATHDGTYYRLGSVRPVRPRGPLDRRTVAPPRGGESGGLQRTAPVFGGVSVGAEATPPPSVHRRKRPERLVRGTRPTVGRAVRRRVLRVSTPVRDGRLNASDRRSG